MSTTRNSEEIKVILNSAQNPHQSHIWGEKSENLWLIRRAELSMLLWSAKKCQNMILTMHNTIVSLPPLRLVSWYRRRPAIPGSEVRGVPFCHSRMEKWLLYIRAHIRNYPVCVYMRVLRMGRRRIYWCLTLSWAQQGSFYCFSHQREQIGSPPSKHFLEGRPTRKKISDRLSAHTAESPQGCLATTWIHEPSDAYTWNQRWMGQVLIPSCASIQGASYRPTTMWYYRYLHSSPPL